MMKKVEQEKKSLIKEYHSFIDLCEQNKLRISYSEWKHGIHGSKMYLRKGFYILEDEIECCFVIANIDVAQELQRKGIFKSFLDHIIENCPYNSIMIECVLNDDLAKFLIKSGFKRSKMYYENLFLRLK